uniref:L1 transposable element RRM domain-containing protein n=1 Tax=Oryzias latipes TaxID=8090 RepID=A0A3P9J2S7_ORYLA
MVNILWIFDLSLYRQKHEQKTKQLWIFQSRIGEAEEPVSAVEDECCVLKGKVEELEKRNKALEDKLVDMETRSRLNNIRVVGLPEGAEGPDPCSFLESWLANALDMGPLRSPLVLERAHRVGRRRATGDPPRPLIMRFLNYKQKVAVMNAARKKGDIRYKNINVRLYNDLATEVHKQRKQYDAVRAQLRITKCQQIEQFLTLSGLIRTSMNKERKWALYWHGKFNN